MKYERRGEEGKRKGNRETESTGRERLEIIGPGILFQPPPTIHYLPEVLTTVHYTTLTSGSFTAFSLGFLQALNTLHPVRQVRRFFVFLGHHNSLGRQVRVLFRTVWAWL